MTNRILCQYPSMKNRDIYRVIYKIETRHNDDVITDAMIEGYIASQARHVYTGYDELMDKGMGKLKARKLVHQVVVDYVNMWRRPKAPWLK